MGDDTYDRVVIGAGIIGACSAYQLVKAGHRRVLLIDQVRLPALLGCDAAGNVASRFHT